jgi:hypothetical protein
MSVKKLRRIAALLAAGGVVAAGIAGIGAFPVARSVAAENGISPEKVREMTRQMLRMQLGREPTQAELDQMAQMMGGAMRAAPAVKSELPASPAEKQAEIDIPAGARIFKASTRQTVENGKALFDSEDSFEVTLEMGNSGMADAKFEDKNAAAEGPLAKERGAGEVVNHATKWIARDERRGCPAPKPQGPVEVLTVKGLTVGQKSLLFWGTLSAPAVTVGVGKDACKGTATETLTEEPRQLNFAIRFKPEWLAESATKTVQISLPYYPAWKFSIGPAGR